VVMYKRRGLIFGLLSAVLCRRKKLNQRSK
jgi:hypothetical protein